jgi:hypothetical protein
LARTGDRRDDSPVDGDATGGPWDDQVAAALNAGAVLTISAVAYGIPAEDVETQPAPKLFVINAKAFTRHHLHVQSLP